MQELLVLPKYWRNNIIIIIHFTDYPDGGSWIREFFSLYGANGIPGLAAKSDFGLARVDYDNYK